MTEGTPGTPDYTMGFSDEMLESLSWHRVETHAAHLLPHLRPGLRVLDVGCGPGALSAELARTVAPGELHGIDMEPSQVELSRSAASAGGLDNAEFRVADAVALPFDDGFFDVVHFHNVLMHVPDVGAVLAEAKRVLKPGGLIGCREMMVGSSFTHPDFGVMEKAWAMFEDLLAADDAHPQTGKELKARLLDAGFAEVRVSGSFDTYSTPQGIAFVHWFANNWFLGPEITEAAIKYGAGTRELYDSIRAAYDRWLEHPGAVCALAYGEAVAEKPGEGA